MDILPNRSRLAIILNLSIAVMVLTARSLSAALIGQKCNSHGECSVSHAFCQIDSSSCGSGTCACTPGFVFDEVEKKCRRAAYLGDTCGNENDRCVPENSECYSGYCRCQRNHRIGPKGSDCVSIQRTKYNGDQCYDSLQCHYNLFCIHNKCQCYDNSYVPANSYSCQERKIGDVCQQDEDCARTSNSACFQGRCTCVSGFTQVTYRETQQKLSLACLLSTTKQGGEDAPCTSNIQCASPFMCTGCGESKICARVEPLLLSKATSQQQNSLFLSASVSLFCFMWIF